MTHQLTQKERMLLQDQLNHEKMCVKKYSGYAKLAHDPEVRRMFDEIAGVEEDHYNVLNSFLGNQSENQQGHGSGFQPFLQEIGLVGSSEMDSENAGASLHGSFGTQTDEALLNDMLMTEKYLSGTYDTAVFECSNPDVRMALQSIQKDEQDHGQRIFEYMQRHGMYTPK